MNMFARFDENPAMTLQVIKETKRYGRTHGCTHGWTDRRTEKVKTVYPPQTKFAGGINTEPPQPMGSLPNNGSTTTEPQPQNGQQPKPVEDLNAFYWYQIFALASIVVKTQTCLALLVHDSLSPSVLC